MGSRLAAELRRAGHPVWWVPQGRSAASTRRAADEGLVARSWAELAAAEVIVCSCAPQGAVDVARRVAKTDFHGVYVEANPLSPRSLDSVVGALGEGVQLVDAGIIGPPPGIGPATHLVLSGPAAAVQVVADLWETTPVTPIVAGPQVGQASAAKAAYALFNKGRIALAVLARSLAAAAEVTDVLTNQSGRPGADILGDAELETSLREVAWRWGPEFDEIARTLAEHQLSPDVATVLRQVWTQLDE